LALRLRWLPAVLRPCRLLEIRCNQSASSPWAVECRHSKSSLRQRLRRCWAGSGFGKVLAGDQFEAVLRQVLRRIGPVLAASHSTKCPKSAERRTLEAGVTQHRHSRSPQQGLTCELKQGLGRRALLTTGSFMVEEGGVITLQHLLRIRHAQLPQGLQQASNRAPPDPS